MKKDYLIFLLFALFNSVFSQSYQIPESAAYDAASKRYFISNYGKGNIVQIDSNGIVSLFKEGLNKPLGMIVVDGTLYVIDNPNYVRGFDIKDCSIKLDVKINEAKFLNDITCDDNDALFVTDSNFEAVFKISRSLNNYTLLVKTKSGNPNGIVYDGFNRRLLVCHFRENSTIDEINLDELTIKTAATPGYNNLDGITMDESGNIYFSSWGAGSFAKGFKREGAILKYDNNFSEAPKIIASELYGPADIFYNNSKNEIAVPMFLEDRVMFIPNSH